MQDTLNQRKRIHIQRRHLADEGTDRKQHPIHQFKLLVERHKERKREREFTRVTYNSFAARSNHSVNYCRLEVALSIINRLGKKYYIERGAGGYYI